MPVARDTLERLAAEYLAAEVQRRPLPPLVTRVPDLSLDEAYQVQETGLALKRGRGERLVGKKIGATSAPIQQLLGVRQPVYGHLFASQQVANGGAIHLAELIQPRIECEIAFILGQPLVGPGVSATDALVATDAVAAALEINDPRTRDWQVDVRDVVADNGLAARFVLGQLRVSPNRLSLPAVSVALQKNGVTVAEATGAAVLGDPAQAVAWLANALAERGQHLEVGEVILPGSLTPIYPVEAGDQVEAVFTGLGSVAVRVV